MVVAFPTISARTDFPILYGNTVYPPLPIARIKPPNFPTSSVPATYYIKDADGNFITDQDGNRLTWS